MSKISRRLALKSETLRTLSGAALDAVVGGQALPNKTGDVTSSPTISSGPTRTSITRTSNHSLCITKTGETLR